MIREIAWSKKAEATFTAIVLYLEKEWGETTAKRFVKKVQTVLKVIAEHPEMFIEYKPNNTRKGLINKNCSVIYRVKASHIQLLVFWDNRKNPKKAP